MNQKNWNEWKIDNRTEKDLEDRIGELAGSYVPEWHFDREDPDIGSVIGKIFARQMAENIGRYNQVLDRYHTEFVNMLGISLLPAKPAAATVLMKLVQDTISGVEVYKGTKLLAETGSGEDQVIFETTHSLYVTSASLDYVFMTQEKEGKVLPLKGRFETPEIVEGQEGLGETGQEGQEVSFGEPEPALKPFRLFGSKEEGIQQNALLFYHSAVMDVEKDNIYVKITKSPKLMKGIEEGRYGFLYYTQDGLLPVEEAKVLPDGETVVLQKEKENAKVELDGKAFSLLVLKAKEPVWENCTLSRIAVSSSGHPAAAGFINNGTTDFDVDSFEPFGDTLSLFEECYVGHDDYFSKAGAVIRITFDVSYREHRILTSLREEDKELKIIKRKPKALWVDSAADARAEEVSFEYFNGIGWKKLNCMQEVKRMFAEENKGRYEISFVCPYDWQEAGAGAYQGRCIRIRLLKSDNCYMRPCIHHYPHVDHLKVSFSYEGHYMEAERLVSLAGTKKTDLTRKVKEGRPFTAFSRSQYTGDALYLGFSRKMESGPVSILFQMEDGTRFEGTRCRFEYSTAKGFKQMKVLDYTMDMSRSGTVMFMPQSDMAPMVLEGKKAVWLRISCAETERMQPLETLPVIRDICLNAVQVANVETREEEDFYLEESRPHMEVGLGVSHILDLDLWVNERGQLSRSQMERMMREEPESVRAEYDIMGDISAFYVKWEEADQLEDVPSDRLYMLDRMNSRLVFGDGIHVKLPAVLDDVAFKAVIRCCNGQEGNVDAGRINDVMGNLMFVDQIYNPVKAYGGSSIETLESALRRGSNILKSRRRLVSMDDYIREILSFSDTIDKVRCVTGETVFGKKKDSAITFVMLLKDFASGSYSFHKIAGMLKKHLLKACELTIAPDDLFLTEPVFVKVSVDVWVEVLHMDDSFEIQNLLQESLERYLNPVSSEAGPGWDIGVMPKKSQLLMRLNILKSKAVIRKMVVTVSYTDQSGTHETDLEDMAESPFVVCRSGSHRVNIMVSEK